MCPPDSAHYVLTANSESAPRSGPWRTAKVAAAESQLGKTQLQGGPPSPPLFQGGRLVAAQRVDTVFDGVYFLAAFSEIPGKGRQGPAVWRLIEPRGVLTVRSLDISAADEAARALTPTTGYSTSTSTSAHRGLAKARSCARDAL